MEHSTPSMHQFGAKQPQAHRIKPLAGLALLVALSLPLASQAAHTLSLQELTEAALQHNPVMRVIQAQQEAATAAVTTATALLNPEIEAGIGPSRYRSGSNETKSNWGMGISQPLEFGNVRQARRALAESGITVADASSELTRSELRSRVRAAYFDVLHRQAILKMVEDDKNLLAEIREKVRLKVELGEAPKYELIKADTESLAAERDYRAAQVRIEEAKATLRGLIGPQFATEFHVRGELPKDKTALNIAQLQQKMGDSPFLRQGRTLSDSAMARLKLEQNLRNPGLTLKAGVEQDPDLTSLRFGIAIPLPLWNQRQGQIAEASAGVREAEALLSERELSLQRQLDATYQRYLIARQQVETFESGLLSKAEAALKVAESAYRFGERGILDYLDAQRTYRAVRKDHITARYDLVSTTLEIERLLGTELLEEQP